MSTSKKMQAYGPGKLYSFAQHPEHKAQLEAWRDRWIAIALRTKPQTKRDRERCHYALRGIYSAAKIEPPPEHREVFCASPISGAIAATVAACVWWLRENPGKHAAIFGRRLADEDLMTAIAPAIAFAVRAGMGIAQTPPAGSALPDAATDAATHAATRDATSDATSDAIVRFYVGAMPNWYGLANGGNHWAGYVSYLSFFRKIADLGLREHEAWLHYERAAQHGSWRFVHTRFWIVSDFPTLIRRDERNLPHGAKGPSIAWRDGWAGYHWRGVEVPREWIEQPELIDPGLALTHPNAEQRRCLAEILGWEKIVARLNVRSIDRDADPSIGELVEVDLPVPGGRPTRERFIRVLCGTGRQFALPVPREMRTALEANAWSYGVDGALLRTMEVRT